MRTSIFFVVRTDNPDTEPVVVAEIYRGIDGIANMVAEHVMTIEGAIVRRSDLTAAITDARVQRRRLKSRRRSHLCLYINETPTVVGHTACNRTDHWHLTRSTTVREYVNCKDCRRAMEAGLA